MRIHGRTDHNQQMIVKCLRGAGVSVASLSDLGSGIPDLLVGAVVPCPDCGFLMRSNLLFEVKNGIGAKLTRAEVHFHTT